jgi:uncharacterized RDD family membrane protein YckC
LRPVTPDVIPTARASPGRAIAPVQMGAPAQPDPKKRTTLISADHQGERMPEPAPTQSDPQEGTNDLFVSPRATEPISGDHVAVPSAPGQPRGIANEIVSEVRRLDERAAQLTTDPGVPAGDAKTGAVEAVEVIAHPASFVRRVMAFVVDGLLLAAVDGLVALGLFAIARVPELPEGLNGLDRLAVRVHDSGKLVVAIVVMAVGLAAAYTTLFAVVWSGRTPGRLLTGIRLVDARGSVPGPVRALIRAVFALVSFSFGLSGFWWALFDRRGQTLHDKLCSTFVVRLGPTRT